MLMPSRVVTDVLSVSRRVERATWLYPALFHTPRKFTTVFSIKLTPAVDLPWHPRRGLAEVYIV